MTTAIIIVLLVILAICLLFWRIIKAIFGPIFSYVYNELLIGSLRKTGMSEGAAKALVSVIIIIIVILILIC